MSTIFREPDHTYEELVRLVTDEYADVEDLTAVTAAIGAPGERLWLAEPHGMVYRVWRKGTGERAYWAMDQESAMDAEKWISERLAGTVLDRLTEPGHSREYALDPGRAEADLAVLDEVERIWLSGRGILRNPEWTDAMIRRRMARVNAELARLKALRARHLTSAYETDEAVAAALDCDPPSARELLAAGDRYRAWIREGAAQAGVRMPVRRPSAPTGLPDDEAARLMTAACQTEIVLDGHAYPEPLPPELAPWYAYVEDAGHCVAVAVDGLYAPDGDPWEYMTVAPVPLLLKVGWSVRDQVIVAPVPYDERLCAVVCEESDRAF